MRNAIFLIVLLTSLGYPKQDFVTFECVFNSFSDEEGIHKSDTKLTLVVNRRTNKALATGNNGTADVTVMKAGGGFTATEITPSGSIQVLTVSSKTHKASYSRNTIIMGVLMPSQHYGTCTKLNPIKNSNHIKKSSKIPLTIQKEVFRELKLEEKLKKYSEIEQDIIIDVLGGKFANDEELDKLSPEAMVLFVEVAVAVGEKISKKEKKTK